MIALIRKANIDDLGIILKLTNDYQVYENKLDKRDKLTSLKKLQEIIKEELSRDNSGAFILLIDNKPHGFIDYSIKGKIGWLRNIYLVDRVRNKGHGRLLVKKLIEYFSLHNCKVVKSFIKPKNVNAEAFWIKQGFIIKNLQIIKKLK